MDHPTTLEKIIMDIDRLEAEVETERQHIRESEESLARIDRNLRQAARILDQYGPVVDEEDSDLSDLIGSQ